MLHFMLRLCPTIFRSYRTWPQSQAQSSECRAAERTAWCAPGITKVNNRITANPPSVASAVETEAGA